MDIKVGDRLATVFRSEGKIVDATIYTVDRVSATAKTGWLNTGDRFKLSFANQRCLDSIGLCQKFKRGDSSAYRLSQLPGLLTRSRGS